MAASLGAPPSSSDSTVSSAIYKPGPEPLKLRNSCQGCAASKLKCPQEKPRCSRCARRGVVCEYLAAKPGGRKPGRRLGSSSTQTVEGRVERRYSNTTAVTTTITAAEPSVYVQPTSQDYWFAPLSSVPEDGSGSVDAGCISVSSVASNHPAQHLFVPLDQSSPRSSDSSNTAQDLFGTLSQVPLSASTTASQIDFSDCLSFAEDLADMDALDTDDIFTAAINEAPEPNGNIDLLVNPFSTFPPFGDTISELFTIPPSPPEPDASVSPTRRGIKQKTRDQPASSELPLHSCLTQALRSLEEVSSPQSASEAPAVSATRAIVASNRAAVEAASSMASCACSQDSYLLVVISLVVFKVLNRYAVAARQGASAVHVQASFGGDDADPSQSRCPAPGKGRAIRQPTQPDRHDDSLDYCLEGAESGRMAAQLVLSELHLVRRVVEQLSSKLKNQAASGGGEPLEGLDGEFLMALPLSTASYDNIALALTQRLRALALDVIGLLKKL